MKIQTSELTGAALDWAVAKCEAWVVGTNDDDLVSFVLEDSAEEMHFWPSTDWAQGGPIIEREGIDTYQSGVWVAEIGGAQTIEGQTPLIAAMRCYVASKLGETVDIPEGIA